MDTKFEAMGKVYSQLEEMDLEMGKHVTQVLKTSSTNSICADGMEELKVAMLARFGAMDTKFEAMGKVHS
jgi:hypothetical protein